MSLLLRSEMRLRLGPLRCEASLWRAGLPGRAVAEVSTPGGEELDIEPLLEALLAEGHDLPTRASICMADEYLYYAVLPASGAWANAQAQARRYFIEAIGTDELLVQTSLTPCGRRWIAVAAESGRIEMLRETLAQRDVELRHVFPALLVDLEALRAELRDDQAVLVIMRTEGASIVDVQDGSISGIAWERIDLDDIGMLTARVQGHLLRHRLAAPGAVQAPGLAVVIAPADPAQHEQLQAVALSNGWRLTAPLQSRAR